MKWELKTKYQIAKNRADASLLLKILLGNRMVRTEKDRKEFLCPPSPHVWPLKSLGISVPVLCQAIAKIRTGIKRGMPIVVYGDYDADGICATAIMYEALKNLGAKVLPYIPLREKEGYGLSREGVDTILTDKKYGIGRDEIIDNRYEIKDKKMDNRNRERGLLIVVDSGVVAHGAVEYARRQGLEVVIIDHHEKPKKLPRADAIVHTEKLCAAGICYFVTRGLEPETGNLEPFLELAAIATVTDLMPLLGPNRAIVKYGIPALERTQRPGLKALYDLAGLKKIGTYEIGYLLGPRLNASGRLEDAMDALRLLCTHDREKANGLARKLDRMNRERQALTEAQTQKAIGIAGKSSPAAERIIIAEHEEYHQGVIGLIAGKLVERYSRPAIVIARGETISKASARSVSGFNVIAAIRSCEELLLDAGGHPMAAGFSIETAKIANFKLQISNLARERITDEMLEKTLKVDMEIALERVDMALYHQLQKLEPFGVGNPEPVFASGAVVQSVRTVGQEGKHLKLQVAPLPTTNCQLPTTLDAIGFGMGEQAKKLKPGNQIKIAYAVALDAFNGNQRLQLKMKDIQS